MYEYVYGFITDVTPNYVVIDVNGVGYKVSTANPYHYQSSQETKVRIYIHQAVSDSAMVLYGFETLSQKQLFEQLLNVSGIGPKSGLAIMAGNDSSSLVNAISTGNVSFLTKFPGIGKKTAQQIILDLKDKIGTAPGVASQTNDESLLVSDNQALADALQALEALGFKRRDVEKVKTKLHEQQGYSTDKFISEGLKLLTK